MGITELRIGNYIQSETTLFEETKWREWQITPDDMKIIIDNPQDYEPIPLTENWFKDFGFVKVDNCNKDTFPNWSIENYGELNPIEVVTNVNGFWTIIQPPLLPIIKYVHQLQNFYFIMTDKELAK